MRRSLRGLHADGEALRKYKDAEEYENSERIREVIRAMRAEKLPPEAWTITAIAGRAGLSKQSVKRRKFAVKVVLDRNPDAAKRLKPEETVLVQELREVVQRLENQLKERNSYIGQLQQEMELQGLASDKLQNQLHSLQRENAKLREQLHRLGKDSDGGKVVTLY